MRVSRARATSRQPCANMRSRCVCDACAMLVRPPLQGIVLISDILRAELQADCSVLMGANVANDMASDAFCETTIGYTNDANGELFKLAYNDPALKVGTVKDTVGVELCGALKNIVAIGAGPRSAVAAVAAYAVNYDARGRDSSSACLHGRLCRRFRLWRQHQGGDHPHRPQGDGEVLQDGPPTPV